MNKDFLKHHAARTAVAVIMLLLSGRPFALLAEEKPPTLSATGAAGSAHESFRLLVNRMLGNDRTEVTAAPDGKYEAHVFITSFTPSRFAAKDPEKSKRVGEILALQGVAKDADNILTTFVPQGLAKLRLTLEMKVYNSQNIQTNVPLYEATITPAQHTKLQQWRKEYATAAFLNPETGLKALTEVWEVNANRFDEVQIKPVR